MSFSQFFKILSARYKVIFLVFFITVSTAVGIALMLPKSYKGVASVIVNYKGIDPVTGLSMPAQLMPGYMPTQIEIITSKKVALQVIDELKLAEGTDIAKKYMEDTKGKGTIKDWLADLLLKNLEAVPSKTSSVIDIEFQGATPQFAATIANAFADAYVQTSIEFKVDPSKKAADYLTSQVSDLGQKLETAQKNLYKFQQDNNMVSPDERMDVERERLNELSSQLVLAQGQLMEAESRQRNAGVNANESPDVASNPLVQNLKSSLASAEAKFADTSERYDKNHPQYIAAKAEIDKLRSELNKQIGIISATVSNNAKILQQREAEIRVALDAQKKKVLELNRTRDQLAVLNREVESAQHAYETAQQRFTQTNLEGQSKQSDITLLNPAVPPIKPSSPKIPLVAAISIFAGIFLGITFALIAEALDRRIRTEDDIESILHAPILGVMPKVKLRRGKWSWKNLFKKKSRSFSSKVEVV